MNRDFVRRIAILERRLDGLRLPETSGRLVEPLLSLPALRAAWPMSSVGYQATDRARDIGGAGYHLTANGGGNIRFGSSVADMAFHCRCASANSQYLSRADGGAGNWADLTGAEGYVDVTYNGLTLLGWVRFIDAASSTETVGGKWVAGSNNKSYLLQRSGTGNMVSIISSDGAAETSIASDDTVDEDTWIFTALRFDPSTSLDVFINADYWSNTTAIPASVYDSTAPFTLGATGTPADHLNGYLSLVGLYAACLSDAQVLGFFGKTRGLFGV